MKLIGVDPVGHRYPGNRCPGLIADFYCALLEFEAVRPSCAHIVPALPDAGQGGVAGRKATRSLAGAVLPFGVHAAT